MSAVTVSPKFQVVIPKDVRNHYNVQVGMKFDVIAYGDIIQFIPIRPIKESRGSLKGIDTTIIREKDRY